MLTIVCWRWRAPYRYRSKYAPSTVYALRDMVARHYRKPHRFLCVTDDPDNLTGVDTMRIWKDGIDILPPEGLKWPSCYVRLRAFSDEARDWFGERFVSLDLDTVIVDDVAPIFDRPEPFVIWNETDWPDVQFYNASIWILTTGARSEVWRTFDPKRSPKLAFQAGARGGDQAWISYVLGPGQPVVTPADGVLSYRRHIVPNGGELPDGARIVNFHGQVDPWSPAAQALSWVRDHYGVVRQAAAS